MNNLKWTIDKSFSFCYGHRVHNQRLDTKFTESGDACLACRHLHGHEGLVKVFLTGPNSNVETTGMVTDFKHLGWFKNFLDDTLDHKFIMDLKDPLFKEEFPMMCSYSEEDGFYIDLLHMHKMDQGYYVPDLTLIKKLCSDLSITQSEQDAIFEKYEGAVFVDFVPTSENLAAWLLRVCQEKMKGLEGVEVVAVEYWETPKSHCRVSTN
jgi:6-pyruvoyltetrahydropterin/6-carboxytetrahydropterin synthase